MWNQNEVSLPELCCPLLISVGGINEDVLKLTVWFTKCVGGKGGRWTAKVMKPIKQNNA